ncbi:MAG: hypothetical protein IJ867_07430 [Clostridia bacterium]|nr:hypothetical protein [Clostridia bacterium]
MGTVLEIRNVNKSFGKKQVLQDISFSINEGEILGFIGPNRSSGRLLRLNLFWDFKGLILERFL